MVKRKRKINIIPLATFLLAVATPALIVRVSSISMWVGEPQLPQKMKSQ